ncbi:hypothetical protein H5410_044387 [Solanum commersonii]|uniref:Uncharacterized protein n=1 Tax=Solanum commersonii TaxID=4109 RepID=A0A9J5X6M8_SOLCO|nr:hypothetical protein H5410_044387 [Solanum commersonii]
MEGREKTKELEDLIFSKQKIQVEAKKTTYTKLVECKDKEEKKTNKNIYKIVKTNFKLANNNKDYNFLTFVRERKTQDLDQDEEGKMCIKVEEVNRTISRMSRRGRTIRLDEISMKLWKSTNKTCMKWLIDLFHDILKEDKLPMK